MYPSGIRNSEIHGFPDWRSSWKKGMVVITASAVIDEQMVNWKDGESSKVAFCLHLFWQTGFDISSQEGEVNHCVLRAKNSKSKSIVNNPHSRCEAELMSKEKKIEQQSHDVGQCGQKLCKTFYTFNITGSTPMKAAENHYPLTLK